MKFFTMKRLSFFLFAAILVQEAHAQGPMKEFSGSTLDKCELLDHFDPSAAWKEPECRKGNGVALLAVQPGEKKAAFTNIVFETNETILRPESIPILDKIAWMLQKTRDKFRIEGHADPRGNPARNMELSIGRAASVRNYLISKGVPASRLTSDGRGDTEVADTNNITAAINRRVVFYAKP